MGIQENVGYKISERSEVPYVSVSVFTNTISKNMHTNFVPF